MIRTVPTSDRGLDLLLGGGWKLITRLQNRESVTVLVRGAAGAGKTLTAFQIALDIAGAMHGDILIGCVEILPSEYRAQVQAWRGPELESQMAILPDSAVSPSQPRVYCGLLSGLEGKDPDLVASLEALISDCKSAGGDPKVVVVDSLIEGYGIGSSTPRVSADALMKFAAQGGHGLVLCEEANEGAPSPWVFAADTVVSLGVANAPGGRWLEIRKHRFGASAAGKHEMRFRDRSPPVVLPQVAAWATSDALRDVGLRERPLGNGGNMTSLVFHDFLGPSSEHAKVTFAARFALVSGRETGVARTVAIALVPEERTATRDLVIVLDPLSASEHPNEVATNVFSLSTTGGPAQFLKGLVEVMLGEPSTDMTEIRRILIGDLAPVLEGPDGIGWAEALRVFVSLVVSSRCGIPVIGYSGIGADTAGHTALANAADLIIRTDRVTGPTTIGKAIERSKRAGLELRWHGFVERTTLPPDLAFFDRLPQVKTS